MLLVLEELEQPQEDEKHADRVHAARQVVNCLALPVGAVVTAASATAAATDTVTTVAAVAAVVVATRLKTAIVQAQRGRAHDEDKGKRVELVPEVADVPEEGSVRGRERILVRGYTVT